MKISNPFIRQDGSKVWTGDTGRRIQEVTVPLNAKRSTRIHQAAERAVKAGRSAS